MFTCPVCFYNHLEEAPRDYSICECCGTEFGNDDEMHSHGDLRAHWIAQGASWFFGDAPVGWNPYVQLLSANFGLLPYHVAEHFSGGVVSSSSASPQDYTPTYDPDFELALAS
jgi:hypothetical protein